MLDWQAAVKQRSMAGMEQRLLQYVSDHNSVDDSGEYARAHELDHNSLVGLLLSLTAAEMIVMKVGFE